MLYIPKIADYLKILVDEEVKNIVSISFVKYFKCNREKSHFKLSEEKNLTKIDESFYIFLTTPDKVRQYVELIVKSQEQKF